MAHTRLQTKLEFKVPQSTRGALATLRYCLKVNSFLQHLLGKHGNRLLCKYGFHCLTVVLQYYSTSIAATAAATIATTTPAATANIAFEVKLLTVNMSTWSNFPAPNYDALIRRSGESQSLWPRARCCKPQCRPCACEKLLITSEVLKYDAANHLSCHCCSHYCCLCSRKQKIAVIFAFLAYANYNRHWY